jgi:hypothetical protein
VKITAGEKIILLVLSSPLHPKEVLLPFMIFFLLLKMKEIP